MKIVVTGGAGFIGSNLLAALEARGEHEIVVCDKLGRGDKWRNLAKREIAALLAPAALHEAMVGDLRRTRQMIEERPPGHRVRHLCLPYTIRSAQGGRRAPRWPAGATG